MEGNPPESGPSVPPQPNPTIPGGGGGQGIGTSPNSSRRLPPSNAELAAIIQAATSGHSPPGKGPMKPARTVSEKRDEWCWTRCRQTNARRALGREPRCTAFCYMNFRHALDSMIPVPGFPGAFLAKDKSPPAHGSKTLPLNTLPPNDSSSDEVPEYRWPWLDGRYIYFARGKSTVQQHENEMGGKDWKGIEEIEKRSEACAKAKREITRAERQDRRMKKAMGLEIDESDERLISLSKTWSNSLQRLHRHVLRIYTPVFQNLARIPETFADGTQYRMIGTIQTKLSDGSAFTLAQRMIDSTISVAKTLQEMKNSRGSGGGSGPLGPLGGPGLPGIGPGVAPPAA